MRALSFTQPWLEGPIFRFGKRVENRDWENCSYRGPILLHAAKSVGTQEDFDDTWDGILNLVHPETRARPCTPHLAFFASPTDSGRLATSAGIATRVTGGRGPLRNLERWAPDEALVRGAIVGRARIDGILRHEADMAAYASNVPGGEAQRKWWFGGFALVLTDVERLDRPIPRKGALGLFEVPEDVVAYARWKPCQEATT